MSDRLRFGRWQRVWGFVLVVLLVVVALLPEVVRLVAISLADREGYGDLVIDDVDLNPFTATLGLDGLRLSRDGEQKLSLGRLEVDLDWLALIDGEVMVEELGLSDTELEVVQHDSGEWEVVIPLPQSDSEPENAASEPLKLSIDQLQLEDIALSIKAMGLDEWLVIEQLTLSDASSWRTVPLSLETELRWSDAPIAFSIAGQPLAESAQLSGNLELDDFPLASIAPLLGRSVAELLGEFDSELSFVVSRRAAGAPWQIELQGEAKLSDLSATQSQLKLKNERMEWQGDLDIALAETPEGRVSGTLALAGLAVNHEQQGSLLTLGNLDIEQLELALTAEATVTGLSLEQLVMMPESEKGRSQLGSLVLDTVTAAEGEIRAGTLRLGDWQQIVERDEAGEFTLQKQLESLLAKPAEEPESKVAEEPEAALKESPRLVLEQLELAGESYLLWRDLSVAPEVEQTLDIEHMIVSGVDTASDQPLELSFAGGIGEFSTVTLSGTASPFAEQPSADAELELKGFSLPEISPYAEQAIGYQLQSGQYDHQLKLSIKGADLNARNALHMRQLKLARAEGKESALDAQLPMPLDLALSMLRDGDDNIELKVPVKGRLDDPDIGINQIVSKALGTALQRGSMSYLKYALQPYGAVLMAAEFIGEQAQRPSLQAISFQPGGSEAAADTAGYLEKIAGLMQQRPGLNLQLCGKAGVQDLAAMQQRALAELAATAPAPATQGEVVPTAPEIDTAVLTELAKQRATRIKSDLVERGVAAERLYECKAEYLPEGKLAGVELGF